MTDWFENNRWWLRRLCMLPVHLFIYAIAIFFLLRLIPGDPVYVISKGQNLSAERYEQMREALGLSGSLWDQFATYMQRILRLDFGTSLTNGGPVWKQLTARLPQTLELATLGMGLVALFTLGTSYIICFHPKAGLAQALRFYGNAAGALPDFILGVAGIYLFYAVLHWVPAPIGLYNPLMSAPPPITGSIIIDSLLQGKWDLLKSVSSHLVLPLIVLMLSYSPIPLKILVRALDDAIDAPATRFRISTGASRVMVIASVYRRALPPTVAIFGTLFGFMLGGVVIIEQLFGMPGMGQYAVDAVNSSDFVSLQAFLLLVAALSLLVFLIVDVAVMLLDPRRRSSPAGGQ